MKNYVGVGLSIGTLAALWTQVSVWTGLITWVGFVAWATYFAAGAGATGLSRGLLANLSGVVYGWLAVGFLGVATFPGALAVGVGVIALFMCLQAGFGPLSFIPGAFVGAASFVGTEFAFWPTVIALVIGAGLGWLSGSLGARIQSGLVKQQPTAEASPG